MLHNVNVYTGTIGYILVLLRLFHDLFDCEIGTFRMLLVEHRSNNPNLVGYFNICRTQYVWRRASFNSPDF